MAKRTYEGKPLDGTEQYISEAPYWQDEDSETVYVTPPEPQGEERTENVPVPDEQPDPPERTGQTTLADWGATKDDD